MDFKKLTDLLKLTTPKKEIAEVVPEIKQELDEKYFIKQDPQEKLFSWKSQIPKFQVPKKILRSGFVFAFLFAVFLVLAQDWVFLLVVLGLIFVLNLLINSKDIRNLEYKIFSNGFSYGETFFSWPELDKFFYYEGMDNLIVITSKDPLPGRIYVYFDPKDREKIESFLVKNLPKNLTHPKDFYEYIIFKVKPFLNLSDEK